MPEQFRRPLIDNVSRIVALDEDGNEVEPDYGSTAPISQVQRTSPSALVDVVCAWATDCARGIIGDDGVYVHRHVYDPPLTEQDVIDLYRET